MQARERAAAQDCGADNARGLVVGDAHVAAARRFLDGHFRDDGYTHAGADHAENAAELAALENDLRIQTGAVAGGNGGVAEAVAVAQEQEWLFAKIFEVQGTASGESVLFRKRGEEAFGKKREGIELVAADGQGENGDIDGAGAKTVEQHRSNFFDHGDARLRELARKGREPRRKKVGGNGGDDAEGERAGYRILALDYIALRSFKFAQDRACPREESFANVGKADGTTEAIEEAGAEFVLQFEDLLGQRRLRDVRVLGGAAEGAGFGDGAEVT